MASDSSSSYGGAVVISGMVGPNTTNFTNHPVIVTVSNLDFPEDSPIKVVRVKVLQSSSVVGEFSADIGADSSISFDISSALRAMWDGYDFSDEIERAQNAAGGNTSYSLTRLTKSFSLQVDTEYIAEDGEYEQESSPVFDGGKCIIGGLTELERSRASYSDVSALNKTNPRNGDASTKPRTSPEMVGSDSITSWVDVSASGTVQKYYPSSATPEPDDVQGGAEWTGHPPIVVRDIVPYIDFLFINKRGAVETCSARMMEALSMAVETKEYARVERPAFKPSRTVMAVAGGGRRSWNMSSGLQTRDWAEWWTLEFLMATKWWMKYEGTYVPVIVSPSKKSIGLYDHTKQEMSSVEFTVTLALEG